ncbi:MAG: NUDIX hydrolase [Bacteriovoracia bacterium]
MTPTHEMNFPSFDPSWPWAGSSVLLTNETHLILIKRSLQMPTHAGQMAFFGGHKKSDETHPFEVACREFTEESGLHAKNIECLGVLPPVFTARAQAIVPVVATLSMSLEGFLQSAVSNGEWDDLLAVPWSELNNPENWSWGLFNGRTTHKVLMTPIRARHYLHHKNQTDKTHILWGATARMIWNYLALYYQAPGRF